MPSDHTKEQKPPIWELWRSIWADMGTLEAVADALPDCAAGAILRGYQEHGLPEILPTAERALREAGLGPDEEASRKTFRRGYQITTLLIRQFEGEEVPPAEFKRDPDEFYDEAQAAWRERRDA